MRWLVTGAEGMLGRDLVTVLDRGTSVAEYFVAMGRRDLDITDAEAVRETLERLRPDVVVNCAGFTGVDAAETERETALAVNGDGARHLARACAAVNARMVQVSTDYVFPGTERSAPYAEEEPTQTHSSYGSSKLAGELAVDEELGRGAVIARTAWLYGRHGGGFVRTLVEKALRRQPVSAISDQHGQPTWTGDLAERLVELGYRPDVSGVLHCTNGGRTTWYDMACEIYTRLGADTDLVSAISASDLDRPAPRPDYSVLGHGRWARVGLPPMRHWSDALTAALPHLTPEGAVAETPPTTGYYPRTPS